MAMNVQPKRRYALQLVVETFRRKRNTDLLSGQMLSGDLDRRRLVGVPGDNDGFVVAVAKAVRDESRRDVNVGHLLLGLLECSPALGATFHRLVHETAFKDVDVALR